MNQPEERGRWRRIDRLVKLVPSLAERLGCRRKNHELRELVKSEALDEDVLKRREKLARGDFS